MPRRLYIVEQNAVSFQGHYFAQTACIAAAAAEAGFDTVVLTNRRATGELPIPGVHQRPSFTRSWGEAEERGGPPERAPMFAPGHLAYDLAAALHDIPPARGDHVLLHTLGLVELQDLLAHLTGAPASPDMPHYHLLLRFDPAQLPPRLPHCARYFARIRASSVLMRHLHFHSDTEPLARHHTLLTGMTFTVVPIPLVHPPAVTSRDAGRPLRAAYLGDARIEKGFLRLPEAARHLLPGHLATGRLELAIQANLNVPGGEPGIAAARDELTGFGPAVTLLREPLPPAEYRRLLDDSDIVLLPYSASRYRRRSSGILIEALAAGKVVVTTAGSWLAEQATRQQAIVADEGEPLGLAIGASVEHFAELSAAARRRQGFWRACSSGSHYLRTLLATAEAAAQAPFIAVRSAASMAPRSAAITAAERLVIAVMREAPLRWADLACLWRVPQPRRDAAVAEACDALLVRRDATLLASDDPGVPEIAAAWEWTTAADVSGIINLALAEFDTAQTGPATVAAPCTAIVHAQFPVALGVLRHDGSIERSNIAVDRNGSEWRALDLGLAGTAAPLAWAIVQTIPIAAATAVLRCRVLGAGWQIAADGGSALLPERAAGELTLPQVATGTRRGAIDLVFEAHGRAMPRPVVRLAGLPVRHELAQAGRRIACRVSLPIAGTADFGLHRLSIATPGQALRLVRLQVCAFAGDVAAAAALLEPLGTAPRASPGPFRTQLRAALWWLGRPRRSAAELIAAADRARDRGIWDAAASAYRAALDRDPGLAGIWIQLGHALKETGDCRGAEAAYRQALALDGGSQADAHLQLAHALKLQARLGDAAQAYFAALVADPNLGAATDELALLGYTRQEVAAALRMGSLALASSD